MSEDFDQDYVLNALEGAFGNIPEPLEETKSEYTGPKPGKFYKFANKVMGFAEMELEPHAEMCEFIETVVGNCKFTGTQQRLAMLGVPRNSFKTSIVAEALPLHILNKNPNARGLITSFRHDTAKARLYAVKWHIENNEKFWAACGDDWRPEFREDIWNDDSIVITKRTKALKEPSLSCAGVGRSMTGSHFDFIIADDLVVEQNSYTPEMRQKVYDYILDLLPVLEPGGVLILVFTRHHPDDAYGRLLRIDRDLERIGKPPEWEKLIRSAYNPDGSLYFPTRLTADFLETQRRRLGSRKFAAQYLNQPISEEDKTFDMTKVKIADFMYFTDSMSPNSGVISTKDGGSFPVNVSIAWDPSGRKYNRHSDFHGLTVVGCDPLDRWWTLEAEGIKGTPTMIVNRVCSLIAHYRPRIISIEDTAQLGLWIDLLQIEIKKRGLMVGIHEYQPRGVAKGARIEMLQPRWESGQIVLRPGQHDLYNQFDQFSPGATLDHEDIIDSYAQHLEVALPALPGQVIKENPVDPEWVERNKRNKTDDLTKPRAGRYGSRWAV